MASSLGSLVVRLSLDAAEYISALTKAESSARQFATNTDRAIRSSAKSISDVSRATDLLKTSFAGVAAAFGVQQLVRTSDEYQNMNARLRIVTDSAEDLARTQLKLLDISNNTRQSLGATTDLYFQMASAVRDSDISQKQLLSVVGGINKALVVSGTSGQSATSAIVQLGQALQRGVLRGQEFTSVSEQANQIIRTLGDGLGKTGKQLKIMADAGEITTDIFIKGFLAGLGTLDVAFSKIPITISGSLVVAQNEFQRFIGTLTQTTSTTSAVATVIVALAKNLDVLSAAALGFLTFKLATFLGEQGKKGLEAAAGIHQSAMATINARNATIAATEAEVVRLGLNAEAIALSRATVQAELAKAVAIKATTGATAASTAATSAAIAELAILGGQQTRNTAQLIAARLVASNLETGVSTAASRAATIAVTQAEVARLTVSAESLIISKAVAQAEYDKARAIEVTTGVTVASSKAIAIAHAELAIQTALQTKNAAALVVAEAALAAAMGATAVKLGFFARALAFLGGPINAIATLLTVGITVWQLWASHVQKAEDDALRSTETSTKDIIANLQKQIEKLRERNRLARNPDEAAVSPQLSQGATTVLDLRRQADEAEARLRNAPTVDRNRKFITPNSAIIQDIKELRDQADALEGFNREMFRTRNEANLIGREQILQDWLEKTATRAQKGELEIQKFRDAVGSLANTPKGKEVIANIRADHATKGKSDDPFKLDIAGQVKDIEASIARERDILNAGQDFLRFSYDQGLLTVAQYYDGVDELRQRNIVNTLKAIDEEIAAQEILYRHFAKQKDKEKEKQDVINKIDAFNERKVNLQRDTGFQTQALARQQVLDSQEYKDQLTEINAKLLEMAGNTAAAAAIRLPIANRKRDNQLTAGGNEVDIAAAKALDDQLFNQNKLSDAQNKYTLELGYQEIAQERLNIARESGAITELDALAKTSEMNKTRVTQLTELLKLVEKYAAASSDPRAMLAVEQMRVSIEKLAAATELVKDKFNEMFSTSFSDALQALANGTKSFRDAVKDFGKDIVGKINKVAADEISAMLFKKGGPLTGIGDFFAKAFGSQEKRGQGVAGAEPTGIESIFSKLFGTKETADATAATSITSLGTSATLAATELGTSFVTSVELAALNVGTTFVAAIETATSALIAMSTSASAAGGASGLGGLGSLLKFDNTGIGYGSAGSVIPPGPYPYASGTSFHPGGWAMLGEFGKEMVNLPRGSQVMSAEQTKDMMSKNITFNQTVNVMPGATTQSAKQASNMLRDVVMRSARER